MPETWPASLPNPSQNYNYSADSNTIRTDMEGGIARQRQRYTTRTRQINVGWELDENQLWTFEGFVQHKLAGGSLWFTIDIALGGDTGAGGLKSNTARIVGGEYTVTYRPHLHYAVTASLEVIDADVMTAAQAATEFP